MYFDCFLIFLIKISTPPPQLFATSQLSLRVRARGRARRGLAGGDAAAGRQLAGLGPTGERVARHGQRNPRPQKSTKPEAAPCGFVG